MRKHGGPFEEAASVFLDALAASGPDPDHGVGEWRHITFGMSMSGTIGCAQRATRLERKIYEEA
ncbi:MAG: hypothetical protein HZC24_06850 [Rhodocyclales bacterium]|nr:hypothetical protein [Rhodocyclales bacterium]